MHLRAWLGLVALILFTSGCWPGRCGGALRGTPMVSFAGDHAPCTEGPQCAELIAADSGFHQRGDFARVDDPSSLLSSSGLAASSWFLVGEDDAPISSRIEAMQHASAHSCASAVGFDLVPEAPLPPGVYRLVLLVDRIHWSVLPQGVDVGTWEGEDAIVQFYRVE